MSSFTFCGVLCFMLIFFSIGYGFMERSLVLQNIHLINSFFDLPNRMKRNDDVCARTCDTSMKSNIDTNAPELKQFFQDKNDPNSVLMMPKSQFQKYCQSIINPAVSCFDQCYSSSVITTVLRKIMVSAKFVCRDHYDEMINNYDCLKSAENVTKAQCVNGKCKDMNQAPKEFLEQSESLGQSRDFDKLKKLLADNCEYVTCTMHCEKPIIAEMCNGRIANLIANDFIGTVMRTTKELLAVGDIEKPVWSAQCENILAETGYGSASKPAEIGYSSGSKSAGVFALISLLLVLLLKFN